MPLPLQLFNDAIDDAPDKVESDGFSGYDTVTEPSKLLPNIVRAGENIWADVDLLLQTRPGLRFNTLLSRLPLGGGSHTPRGLGYYDIVGFERVLAAADGKLIEILGDGNNVTSNVLAGPTPSATADSRFAQFIDRMFRSDGVLNWHLYSAGWTHGQVTTFSDASPMPTWDGICAHKFRLLAWEPGGYKLYASAVGVASVAANWVPTENIRVGSGEGDPIKAVISGQASYAIVLNERSAYAVDTTAASVANWTATKISGLAGCIEGKTAVLIGQDVIFLSAFGVVSLGALSRLNSINPATSLSAPIQPCIDRINRAAIATAWATMWRDLYILAVPLDGATTPNTFLVFNTTTRQWATPWKTTLPTLNLGGGNTIAFTGFAAGVATNFGSNQETLIADNCGRVLRIDKTYEKDESAAGTTQEIVSWATQKAFNHDLPENFKQPFWLTVDWFHSTAALVQLNFVRDGLQTYPDKALNACQIVASGLATNSLQTFPIKFRLQFQANESYTKGFNLRGLTRYRNAGIQIVCQQGKLKLRALRLSSYLDAAALSIG